MPRMSVPESVICALLVFIFSAGLMACGNAKSVGGSTFIPAASHATATQDLEHSPSGDIPDNATYLTFHGQVFSLQYVEGWVQEQQSSNGIRFADKDSFVSVALLSAPSGSMVDYAHGQGTRDSASEFQQFSNGHVNSASLPAGEAGLLTFQALSAPDPVTGKRVMLAFNRYYIRGSKYMAVLTEATPAGVDNVDGFLQIAKSFAWSGQ